MDFCEICGILLFDSRAGKAMCAACQNASDEAKQHSKGGACDCIMCKSQFDWDNTENKVQHSPKMNSTHKKDRTPREELVEDALKTKWEREQLALKQQLQTEDSITIKNIRRKIETDSLREDELFIGGVDISFIKGDEVNACAAFVVLNYPDLEVVYEDYKMIELTAPYIPGFLAFREVEFIVQQYEVLKHTNPEYLPQVIFVDGNGILHPRGFGLASHLGVLLDVACVGVAKTLIHVEGVEDNQDHKEKKNQLKRGGDAFPLVTKAGYVLGKALRSSDSTTNPIYVSVGHQISLETAVWLVYKCCQYRIPEPTRKADLNSREYLRVNHPQGCQ